MAWSVAVGTDQRAEAIGQLAQNFLDDKIVDNERDSALQVMTLYVSDPSPKVRSALATVLAKSKDAPKTLIWSLAEDVPEVSAPIFQHHVSIRSSALVHEIKRQDPLTQIAVAKREAVDGDAARCLVEQGCERAVEALLTNEFAVLGPILKHEIAVRLGECPSIRAELLKHDDLAPRTRQMLVERLSASLLSFASSNNWVDGNRLSNVTNDTCNRVSIDIAGRTDPAEMQEYVEHLRDTNQLTAALLVRAACNGNAALLESALSILSGMSLKRVQAIVDDARVASFKSLYARTGLPQGAYNLFKAAIQVWQTSNDISEALVEITARVEDDPDTDGALFALLGRMAGEVSRECAKTYERQLLLAA